MKIFNFKNDVNQTYDYSPWFSQIDLEARMGPGGPGGPSGPGGMGDRIVGGGPAEVGSWPFIGTG